jgi:hypothetical protein
LDFDGIIGEDVHNRFAVALLDFKRKKYTATNSNFDGCIAIVPHAGMKQTSRES